MKNEMLSMLVKKPLLTLTLVTVVLLLLVTSFSPSPFSQIPLYYATGGEAEEIWSAKRVLDWRPCKWWLQGHFTDNCVWFTVLKCCSFAGQDQWLHSSGLLWRAESNEERSM